MSLDLLRFSLYQERAAVVTVLYTILVFALPINSKLHVDASRVCNSSRHLALTYITLGQCPSTPSITSFDVCQVVSQGSLSYLCRDDGGGTVVWTSSVWSGTLSVSGGFPVSAFPQVTVSGVTLSESNSIDMLCVNSTLSFNGDLTALSLLNGATLTCDAPGNPDDTVTIVVPGTQK